MAVKDVKFLIGDENSDTYIAEYDGNFIIQDCEMNEEGDIIGKKIRVERKIASES